MQERVGGSTKPPSRKDHLVNKLHLIIAGIINRDLEVVNVAGVYASVLATFT